MNKYRKQNTHTPAYDGVDPEELLLLSKCENKQSLEVQALHKQPEEIGQDAVLEERYCRFTLHLMDR